MEIFSSQQVLTNLKAKQVFFGTIKGDALKNLKSEFININTHINIKAIVWTICCAVLSLLVYIFINSAKFSEVIKTYQLNKSMPFVICLFGGLGIIGLFFIYKIDRILRKKRQTKHLYLLNDFLNRLDNNTIYSLYLSIRDQFNQDENGKNFDNWFGLYIKDQKKLIVIKDQLWFKIVTQSNGSSNYKSGRRVISSAILINDVSQEQFFEWAEKNFNLLKKSKAIIEPGNKIEEITFDNPVSLYRIIESKKLINLLEK